MNGVADIKGHSQRNGGLLFWGEEWICAVCILMERGNREREVEDSRQEKFKE